MHYHIAIDSRFWQMRYPHWGALTIAEQEHLYKQFCEKVNAWAQGKDGSLVTNDDLIKITVIEPTGLITITPLFDPADIIRDFLALVTDNLVLAPHESGTYDQQKTADSKTAAAKAQVVERANAYLSTRSVIPGGTREQVQPSQPQHVHLSGK